jgi:transcription initiation factor TFIIF subunit alpha
MKFESRGKEVDLTKWNGPIKLNRKDYKPPEDTTGDPPPPIELTPMLGPDGKPVIGIDGKIVMVGPDGKVPPPGGATTRANGTSQAKNGKGKGKQMFKKKTRQVFLVDPETRQLRREERYPWVMEESGPNGQVWVGHLDDPTKAETHGFLVPMGTQFQFVPMHRCYKFQKRPTYKILGVAEAEAEVSC